ncbi:EI24 domain-containing protein [Nocardiopsis sp. CNT312]|uniref:EI24 domain-containing protein n=1 Tax=Nocardiopsis sp. CNT312 TaxID=1137268 RepID=UPI00048E7C83|nr:EI24 domain-containing protein [Nocardiopsis sp. CNT312]
MGNWVREFLGGAGLLPRGLFILARRPRMLLLGALPPLITSVLFLWAFAALLFHLPGLAAWATPFAADWDENLRGLLRLAVALGIGAGAVAAMVVTFTTVTLTLGSPIYDKLSEMVEQELGDAPEGSDEPLLASIVRALRQALAIVLASLAVTLAVFVIGFVPVVGQVAAPVLAATLGGWLLTIELLGSAFDRRNMLFIRDRRHHMRTRRMRVLGFAVPTYFLLAVPFVAIAVFPAAVAGSTILARDLLGAPSQRPVHGPRAPLPPQAPHGSPPRSGPGVPGPHHGPGWR